MSDKPAVPEQDGYYWVKWRKGLLDAPTAKPAEPSIVVLVTNEKPSRKIPYKRYILESGGAADYPEWDLEDAEKFIEEWSGPLKPPEGWA